MDKKKRDRIDDRPYSRWNKLTFLVGKVFVIYPDSVFPLSEIYTSMRTLHLNGHIKEYSENAIRGILRRFVNAGYILRQRRRIKRLTSYFQLTPKGFDILGEAVRYFDNTWSQDEGILAQVPRTDDVTKSVGVKGAELVELMLSEFSDYLDWNNAWFEGRSLVFTTDRHIAEKINDACDTKARKRSAGKHGEVSYRLNVWPTTGRVRVWPKHVSVEKDLATWLVKKVRLGYEDLKRFFADFKRASRKAKIIVEVPSKIDVPNGSQFFLRMGIQRGSRMGEIPRESSTSRLRSMVRHESGPRLHATLRGSGYSYLAKVLRVQRGLGKDPRRGHGPSLRPHEENRGLRTSEHGALGLHSEIFRKEIQITGGVC